MRIHRFACVAAGAVLVGCYTLQPSGGIVPEAGADVALDISDAGRVALGGSMGPAIAQVEGRLLERDTTDYVVAVSAIHLLNGGEQSWSGERISIRSEYVTSVYRRRLSTGRSIALGALTVGAGAFIITRGILGAGKNDPVLPPPDSVTTHRIPIRP